MPELSPEAARILAARQAAVEELKSLDGIERPINDHLVMRLAGARLYAEGVTLRVVNGEPVTASEFKAANDMIEAARDVAASVRPVKAELVIVHRAAPPKPAPAPEPPTKLLPAPDVIDGEVVNTGAPSPEQLSTPTADVPAASAAPAQPPRRDPGSIHDAVLPNGQRARMAPGASAQLGGFGHACFGGGVLSEPAQNWSASHPLPTE